MRCTNEKTFGFFRQKFRLLSAYFITTRLRLHTNTEATHAGMLEKIEITKIVDVESEHTRDPCDCQFGNANRCNVCRNEINYNGHNNVDMFYNFSSRKVISKIPAGRNAGLFSPPSSSKMRVQVVEYDLRLSVI